ncbi:PEP/pyruvate-binding domain-containing protein [Maridesulfovibrio bastinii]|uniref:PEP/pyruvate-binding domain-containing protein n=1 Tax=Maridesulfovibrio bastinii TaxID=47157 RepID=UPI000429A5FF|nr:PEP/pyruvate-binding domain-containing protein [Maridesulfovibrio bastinii]
MSFRQLFLHWTYESFPPGRLLRSRYNAFKRLIDLEEESMLIIAEIEEMDFGRRKADWQRVEKLTESLGFKVREMLEQLQTMNPVRFMDIMDYYNKINFYCRMAVTVPDPDISEPFIYPLSEAENNINASGVPALELCRAEKSTDIKISESTVFSANIYHYFSEANDLRRIIDHELSLINPDDELSVKSISEELTGIINKSHMPDVIANEMEIAALELARGGKNVSLISSATPEGSPTPLGGILHREAQIIPADIVKAWKRSVAAKYSVSFLKKRIAGNFADGETPVVSILQPDDGKGYDGELVTRAERAELPGSAEPDDNYMSIVCRSNPGIKILVTDKKYRPIGRSDDYPLSEHTLRQLSEAGAAIRDKAGKELSISWRTDSRKRLHITSITPLEENTKNSFDRFSKALPHIARLNLSTNDADSFLPEKSRSMYDLVRFSNEKGIAEMFALVSKEGLGLDGSKSLSARIPVTLNILNLADGLFTTAAGKQVISPDDVKSAPMWALWFGLDSETINWADTPEVELSGYAILARTYMNLTVKFKHEFAEIDAVCGPEEKQNHVHFRFKGGAGNNEARLTRLKFMTMILESQNFKVKRVGDLIEAALSGYKDSITQKRLATIGLLIAMSATRTEDISDREKSGMIASQIIGSVS